MRYDVDFFSYVFYNYEQNTQRIVVFVSSTLLAKQKKTFLSWLHEVDLIILIFYHI